jgi:hypothetical protein
MKMNIEITIRLSDDAEVISMEIDQHTDEVQKEKLSCLAAQIKEFCEWFRDTKITLQ